MATKIMPVSDFRRQTSQTIKGLQSDGEAVFITQYGRPVAVLVSYQQYEELSAEIEELSNLLSQAEGTASEN